MRKYLIAGILLLLSLTVLSCAKKTFPQPIIVKKPIPAYKTGGDTTYYEAWRECESDMLRAIQECKEIK